MNKLLILSMFLSSFAMAGEPSPSQDMNDVRTSAGQAFKAKKFCPYETTVSAVDKAAAQPEGDEVVQAGSASVVN